MDTDIKTYSTRFGNSRTTFNKPILAQNRWEGPRTRRVAGPEERNPCMCWLDGVHAGEVYVETGLLGQLIGAFVAARDRLTDTDRTQAEEQVDNLNNDMG